MNSTTTTAAAASSSNNETIEKSQSHRPPIVIMDGKETAKLIRQELTGIIQTMTTTTTTTSSTTTTLAENKESIVRPGLAVVLVGNRVDSATYVRMKKRAAEEIGIHSIDVTLPDTITQNELKDEIDKLNRNEQIHGILVQLPLPKHIDESEILKSISFTKDADGFTAENIGRLWLGRGTNVGKQPPLAIPCTPAGCIELLQRYDVDITGKECVVLGRSNIVGMPVAALLQSCNGTVTVCHSRTMNIPDIVKRADILIAAIGKPEYVRGEWLKPGVVVIDVGINEKIDPTKKRGYRLVGDVNYEEACQKASFITPVPGGVGPMTIAMLMKNTVNLCRHSLGLPRLQLRNKIHRNMSQRNFVNTK